MDASTFSAIWLYFGVLSALLITGAALYDPRRFQARFCVSQRRMPMLVLAIAIATVIAWPVLGFLSLRNSRA